ncbi:RES family NAD+ phosphorylase [Falsiroseomonas oryzae]|uniref:RES family NAD+ phosphorylase n=1 Tax=Falsiroseomonas oryzae TaxID=2766473 RepID=UPI0022EB2F8F|nr:RES family NAD+ phosphorylase [Roseomonas sp. MO-31]
MIDPASVSTSGVQWVGARRIIRSIHPPIDLFEDIADPEDWPLLIAAEMKTNPRLKEAIGNLDQVLPARRVSGPGASYLMAPFTHASPDRPSRFSDGRHGVLYVGRTFETALAETIHHHERFMVATTQEPGWTSQFRELVLDVRGELHDLRSGGDFASALDPDAYATAQALAVALRVAGSEGLVYPSVGDAGGECAGLFYPDLAGSVVQGRHLDYHWDGARVDLVREVSTPSRVFRVG